ncbi:hypothetical protein BpHYR1_002486 [Brachionus plicatilis]|uniref:Uncharacterized protein n=1 Tax=Brachionus plicatilis TaxID=10195 RepID=A0A3M7QQE6_BRAPC|nr:hypothetical protein BpHYR1_002486 [Brachionus plicatilis]
MNIEPNDESSIKTESSILENEKRFIQQAYQNAANKFGLVPNTDQLSRSSKNPVPKYISQKCEPNQQTSTNSFNSIQMAKLVCHLKWVKNGDSKWIAVESSHVKEHGDYSNYFIASKNHELTCRKSSSDSILSNLKESESEAIVRQIEASPTHSSISFDKHSNHEVQLD